MGANLKFEMRLEQISGIFFFACFAFSKTSLINKMPRCLSSPPADDWTLYVAISHTHSLSLFCEELGR